MTTLVDYRAFNHTPEIVKLKTGGVMYPDYDSYEILGNVLTPRIYGKDLSVFEVASSGRIALTVNDVYSLDLSRTNDTSNVTIATNNNDTLTLASSNKIGIKTSELTASACNLAFKSVSASFSNEADFTVTSASVAVTSASNFTLSTSGTFLSATQSNVVWKAAKDWTVQSSNNVAIQSLSNIIMSSGDRSYMTLAGGTGNVDLRGDQVQIFTNNPGSATAPLTRAMSIYREPGTGNNIVKVEGNLVITGTFETQDVLNTNLNVNDKVIEVAYPSGGTPNADGPLNDGAGVLVNGVVTGTKQFNTEAERIEYYKKALLWRHGKGGIDMLGTSAGVSASTFDLDESYWDVRGGGLMFTVCKQDTASKNLYNLSYGFRINEHDQLELYKRVRGANGSYVIKRINRWGGGAPVIL